MVIELRVSSSVSVTGPHFQLALPSSGSLRLRFPGLNGTTARSDSSIPFPRRFVSFGLRYHAASTYQCRFEGRVLPAQSLGSGLRPVSLRGDIEASQVPGESAACMPCSTTPARPNPSGPLDGPVLPSEGETSSALASVGFEAQSHGLHAGCLRFAAEVTLVPRKTRFRLGTSLPRAGLITRGTPLKVSDSGHSFSFSRLAWRTSPAPLVGA
jgi:hypothetical protein